MSSQGMPGGMPPQIAALLGAAHQQGPPQQGPPPQQGGESPSSILARMVEDAKRYLDLEPDAEDRAVVADILKTLIAREAKDQKEEHAALGGKLSPRMMARSYG